MPRAPSHPPLAESHPALVAELLLERTLDVRLNTLHAGAHRSVFWRCTRCSFEWEAPVRARAAGQKPCRRCLSLARRYPALAAEWHPTLNGTVSPEHVAPNCIKRRWWTCAVCKSPWLATPNQRVQGSTSCSKCSKVRTAEALRLASAEVLERFGALNIEVRAEAYRNNSTPVPVRFLGCGHHGSISLEKSQASAKAGNSRGLCQKCSRAAGTALRRAPQSDAAARFSAHELRLLETFRSVRTRHRVLHEACGQEGLAQLYTLERGHPMWCTACHSVALRAPHLVHEWHESNPQKPIEVAVGARLEVLWCFEPCGHVEPLSVKARALGKQGCPVCAGRRVRPSNCLATRIPEIAAEWHPTLNGSLGPQDVTWSAGRSVWWRCAIDPSHEWRTKVNARTSSGTGCPECSYGRQSECEVRVAFELKEFFEFDVRDRRISIPGRKRCEEVDIKIPAHRVVIEYDGAYYHQNRLDRDRAKTAALEAAGWTVVRMREATLPPVTGRDVLLPPRATVKQSVDLLLRQLSATLGLTLPSMGEYVSQPAHRRSSEADAYLRALLLRQSKPTNDGGRRSRAN